MPTALNSGYQALPPGVPTPPAPDTPVRKNQPVPFEIEQLPHFYGLAYFHNRLATLGLTKDDAISYGLDVDAQGNILQLVRRFDGSFIEFIPQRFRKNVDRFLNHRSSYQPHLEMYHRLLTVTRFHPDHLKANPRSPKYGNQYGEKVRPLPAPLAVKAYNNGTTGGLITFIEGYFKAIALDRAGIESVAFTGITVYRIDPALREYLLRRLPERIFIMYDNDALDVSSSSPAPPTSNAPAPAPYDTHITCGSNVTPATPPKCGSTTRPQNHKTPLLSSRRNEDFANSARKFATALFSLFSSVNHTCEVVFVMGKPGTPEKGIDDLIATHGSDPVTQDLLDFSFSPTFRSSKFFSGFTLTKSSGNRKLNRLFLGNNYRHWIERLQNPAPSSRAQRAPNSGSLKAKRLPPKSSEAASNGSSAFAYRSAHYTPISTGNLYDETITYELNTDPFAVTVPTDHLVIKQYLTDQNQALLRLIADHDRLAIRAPTGSGKTTFLIKYAKRSKTRMVIAMPTINLAEQTARGTGGFVLTGERNTAKIRAANDKHLIICTYDTLHQVPDLWRRILVIDEAHNLINQYGQVYNGYHPFRAETLRNCVRRFPEAQKTILLSGTMPPLLCHAFNFHLVTFRRLENPTVRVFDVEANGTDNTALSKCLLTRLAEIFPPRASSPETPSSSRAQRASPPATSPLSSGPPKAAAKLTGSGERFPTSSPAPTKSAQHASPSGSLKAQRLPPKRSAAPSTSAASKTASGRLHVVFWNNTDQITTLKQTLIALHLLTEPEIAIISRTHYNAGDSPDLDDIIRNQKINPRIKLLLCTCLISEGVNIKNTNVGRIYTVGLRCEDTFRQFIARFRKLKTVNVFSILEAERDLRPEFFPSAKIELLENLERAQLQADHLRRRHTAYHCDYADTELPFLDQIEGTKDYQYRNQLLNLVYRDGDWHPDPLHVLAAIHGRKLATSNNCYFYTRLRANNFAVFRVKQTPIDERVKETINVQHESAKIIRKDFRKALLEDLISHPEDPINALYLIYQEKKNRHGLQALRTLAPDLLDDHDGATGAQYLGQHRQHLDDYAVRRILRLAKLHALGVPDKAPFLSLSITDFNHEYQAALFHFEQLVANDPELRKQMLPAHKEEVRIKQKIVATLTSAASCLVSPLPRRGAGGEGISGDALLQLLAPLLSVPRPRQLPPRAIPDYRKQKPLPHAQPAFSIIGLTPAKAINLLRRIVHTTVSGEGRYRTINIGLPFSKASPPALAAEARHLLRDPGRVLQLLNT